MWESQIPQILHKPYSILFFVKKISRRRKDVLQVNVKNLYCNKKVIVRVKNLYCNKIVIITLSEYQPVVHYFYSKK